MSAELAVDFVTAVLGAGKPRLLIANAVVELRGIYELDELSKFLYQSRTWRLAFRLPFLNVLFVRSGISSRLCNVHIRTTLSAGIKHS